MRIARFNLGVLFISWAVSKGVAEIPSTPHSPIDPQAITVEALHSGLKGDWDQRDAGLERALELSHGEKLARWHKGYLGYGKAWVHYDQLDDLLPIRQTLAVYEAQREHAKDDVTSHLELANWCRKYKLSEQERAHLSRVVQLDSNHRVARRRLGYRLVDGQWVSKSELWQTASRSQETLRAFRRWQSELKKLRAALDGKNEAQRLDAKERLVAVRELEAIPGIEVIFLSPPSRHAELALAAIHNMPQHQASLALARQAVVATHESLRRQAIEYLASRSQDDYVPALIDTLRNPIVATSAIEFVDGRLCYRHVLYQESRDQKDMAVMDTRYARQPGLQGVRPVLRGTPRAVVGTSQADAISLAFTNVRVTEASRQQSRAQYNYALSVLNGRIVSVLAQTTGHTELNSPSDWWSWWDEENGISYPEKPTRSRYTKNDILIPAQYETQPPPCECFAAGTQVWTATGSKPIESIRIGDLVLSQDVETGEVALKPVLTTTTRPAERLVRIATDLDELEATEGHPLWVPESGWTLARKLAASTPLYALDKSVEIHAVTQGGNRETYNLVVADYHTYFVGESRILSHDNTRRRPTNALLPGLPR